jgi:hypothetical protein
LRRLLSACAHACAQWTEEDGRCARSIFAGLKVLFDESLGVSTEVRTAYAVFIILSIFVAAVSFVYRIVAARSVHQVRPTTHAVRARLGSRASSAQAGRSACEPALGHCLLVRLFVQVVAGFHRANQDSEEPDEAAAFMRKLQWVLDKRLERWEVL